MYLYIFIFLFMYVLYKTYRYKPSYIDQWANSIRVYKKFNEPVYYDLLKEIDCYKRKVCSKDNVIDIYDSLIYTIPTIFVVNNFYSNKRIELINILN